MGFIIRWIVAFALLALTYNPTDWNLVRWSLANWQTQMPLAVFLILVATAVYIVFLTAVLRGIGAFGAALVLAVFAALVWVLVDFGWLRLDNPGVNTWLALGAMSLVLAFGMYWGILWRRISGQLEVDDEKA